MARKPAPAPLAEIDENPRAVIGGNMGPSLFTSEAINALLPDQYRDLAANVTKMLANAREEIPDKILTIEQQAVVTRTVVTMRDELTKILSHHKKEKEPYLRAGQAVDQFFFSMRDRLTKAKEIIEKRGDGFTQRQLAAERAEREQREREATERARKAQEEADLLAQQQRDAEAAAERARSKKKTEELTEAAEQLADDRVEADARAAVAAQAADDARREADAKAADIVRTRFDSGHMSTARQVGYADVTDYNLLPLEVLRPYIKQAELERAVKAYAKMTDYSATIAGANIGKRDGTVYR